MCNFFQLPFQDLLIRFMQTKRRVAGSKTLTNEFEQQQEFLKFSVYKIYRDIDQVSIVLFTIIAKEARAYCNVACVASIPLKEEPIGNAKIGVIAGYSSFVQEN